MSVDREELDVATRDGIAHAWTCRSRPGPLPALLLYTDAYGIRPAMQDAATRLADLGYLVFMPDVFYRAGRVPPFDIATVWDVPAERERLMALIRSLTAERVAADAGAYLDAIAAQRDVRQDRIGVAGYCMGGRMAFLTAASHPDQIRAAASFHGGGLVTDQPDSPHRLADRVKASLYFGVADGDPSCTPAHQGALATALGAAHVEYCIELYPGKRHGFAVSDHVGRYDRAAAERHWRRLEWFLGETLGQRA